MCETLLFKEKFSSQAITEIYDIANNYGEPVEVLKALGKYGELKAIEPEIAKLYMLKSELTSQIFQLNKQLTDLRAETDELKNITQGILAPLSTELHQNIDSIKHFKDAIDDITLTYQESLEDLDTKYKQQCEKLGEQRAAAGKFEEELRLARLIRTIHEYPSVVKELPFDQAILLQDCVAKFCAAKGFNLKIRPPKTVYSKHSFFLDCELSDLMDWVMSGLKTGLCLKHDSERGRE